VSRRLLISFNFLTKGLEVSLLMVSALAYTDLGITLMEVGILGMVFVVVQVSASLLSSYAAKSLGIWMAIVLAISAYVLAWLGLALNPNFWVLVFVYGLGGLGSGLFDPLGNSLVAAEAKTQSRGTEIANYGAFGDLGRIIVSTFASSLFALFGWKYLAIAFGLITLGLLLISIVTKSERKIEVYMISNRAYVKELLSFLKHKRFMLANLTGILDSFSGASLYIFIPFLLLQKGIPAQVLGFFVSPLYFGGYLLGRVLLGRMADRMGSVKTLIFAEMVMAISILMFLYSSNIVWTGLVLIILGMFSRGTSPVIKTMIAESISDKQDYEKGYGIYSSSSKLASIVSRPLYSLVGTILGIPSIFFLSAAVAVVTTLPAYSIKKGNSL